MMQLHRFGVSVEKELLDKFDRYIRQKKYTNRSKALGDMIRHEIIGEEWRQGKEVAGAITIIYDHHKRELLDKITDIQHDHQKAIISTQHVHLDHNNCLEIIAVRGKAREVQGLADTLKAVKGVKHGTLSMSTTGKED